VSDRSMRGEISPLLERAHRQALSGTFVLGEKYASKRADRGQGQGVFSFPPCSCPPGYILLCAGRRRRCQRRGARGWPGPPPLLGGGFQGGRPAYTRSWRVQRGPGCHRWRSISRIRAWGRLSCIRTDVPVDNLWITRGQPVDNCVYVKQKAKNCGAFASTGRPAHAV